MAKFKHPEIKDDEINIGNLEINCVEKEDFDLVKKQTGLKTIRIANKTYDESGKEIRQMQGICDIYGPFTLFIKKSEFKEIKQKDKTIDRRVILLKKIINRDTVIT